jgi:hypothetical protein
VIKRAAAWKQAATGGDFPPILMGFILAAVKPSQGSGCMANEEHLARLRGRVKAWNGWNAWRKKHPNIIPNLTGADLTETNLIRADLDRADLRRANLRGASLTEANLMRSNLSGASLSGANLQGAYLTEANLSGASLSGANLQGAYLIEANLGGATFSRTVFTDVNLSTAKGLESCTHTGSSALDHRTLQRSGRLPLTFLRGCGLPDRLIAYLPSLLEEAIQYYSCFISYSSKDEAFAKRLHADLQNNGVRCWFAPKDMKIGDKFRQRIDEAIHVHERLLLTRISHHWGLLGRI